MKKPKFKVGDRVVYFGEYPTNLPAEYGKVYSIYSFNRYNNELIYLDDDDIMVREDEIELEEIYNSPLYKALT